MILVYFRWPQPVDSATNRTVPICPQSRVSVLFCSLSSPALDRSAPNRGSPGGGGESPQASSIFRRPLAGVSDLVRTSVEFSDSVDSCYAIPAPPVPLHRAFSPPEWPLRVYKNRGPSFCRPRGSRETTPKPPRSALRGPWAAREASRAAFGGLRASFGSLRGLFPMFLVYFRWPRPVDSATNRTVPICPQSRVSVLFCSLTSPALDRSAPNRGSPGGGGESPQASSIRRPLAGVFRRRSRFRQILQKYAVCEAIPAHPLPLY